MEIKIVITKKNKEKALRLIDQLVECEAEGTAEESKRPSTSEPIAIGFSISSKSVEELQEVEGLEFAGPEIKASRFGAWGMFNSYVPGKAAIRVLADLLNRNGGKPIRFSDLIDECITYFSKSGLYRFKGFPKKTKESARGRLVTHLILPFDEMGLIRVNGDKKDLHVGMTSEGLAFAKLRNPLLDGGDATKSLSEEEIIWMKNYLKRIDAMGYQEFSILKGLAEFLTSEEKQFDDIANWFINNQGFADWLRVGSRYRDDPKAFSKQLQNVGRTFASGKIALLRELGVLSTSRGTYHVLSSLEV